MMLRHFRLRLLTTMRSPSLLLPFLLLAGCDGVPTGPEDPGLPHGYTVVPIGTPSTDQIPGNAFVMPVAINNRGQLGLDNSYYGKFVALWSDGEFTVYPSALGARGSGMNDAGRLVGCTGTNQHTREESRPFVAEGGRLWYLAGTGLERGCAADINDAGTIVGTAHLPEGVRAFILSHGRVTFVEVPGDTASEAAAVNSSGHVAINSSRTRVDRMYVSQMKRAALWRNGELVDLGYLDWTAAGPGQVADVSEFLHTAHDLNDRDEVVGNAWGLVCTPDRNSCFSRSRAFLWRNGKMIDLGKERDSHSSSALAINRWGHVLVAVYTPQGTDPHLWSDGRLLDLNEAIAESGWKLLGATGLNDDGQVVGWGENTATGERGVVRLDPA